MIRWLHLSDVHEHPGEENNRRRLYDEIVREVERRTKASNGAQPHFVFLTGDLAFTGKEEEYETLKRAFIEPLRAALPDSRFFAVPGNHDLMRKRVVNPRLWMAEEKEAELFHAASKAGAEKRRDALFPRFEPFAVFDRDVSQWTDKDWLRSETGAATWRGTVDGLEIAVVGLNTAWLCHDDKDWGTLTPGRGLLDQALDEVTKTGTADLLFVLGHHPLEAFEGQSRNDGRRVRERLGKQNALYLHGHLHLAGSQTIGDSLRSTLAIQAPSAFQKGKSDDPKWRNGIMWGHADTQTHRIGIEPFKWNDGYKEFKFDNDSGPNDHQEGDHFFYPWPGRRPDAPSRASSPPLAPPPVSPAAAYAPPPGWQVVMRDTLAATRSDAPTTGQLIGFFDGQLPTWNLALAPSVSPRNIVDTLTAKFANLHGGARRPNVVLLSGAGGDGKSTAALQVAARLVEDDGHSWTCLHRQASHAVVPPALFNDLPIRPDHAWIIVIDDADNGAFKVWDAVKAARARTDVHVLLIARLADWSMSAPKPGQWGEFCDFSSDYVLKDLKEDEALRMVRGWHSLGDAAMGELRGQTAEDAARALFGHARDLGARREEGTLLGALMMARQGRELRQRVRSMLGGLPNTPVIGSYGLRSVYTMVAVMHAENQLYLTPRVLAKALGCDVDELERRALRPLRQEAMLNGGDAHLLTRHRSIAEAAIAVLEEDDQEPYQWPPLLAKAGKKDFLQTRDKTHVEEWTFNLARHFAKTERRWPIARAVAKAVLDAEPGHYQSVTACSQIHRITEDAAGGFRILLATGERFRERRDVLHEWGTVAGKLGDHGLSAWLGGCSLADHGAELSPERCKLSLAGLGVAFESLYKKTLTDSRFVRAQAACGQLGLMLPGLDPTALGYFEKYVAAGRKAKVPSHSPADAVKAIGAAVILAADEVEHREDSKEHPRIDPVYFEKLLGEPEDYRYDALLRMISPPRSAKPSPTPKNGGPRPPPRRRT